MTSLKEMSSWHQSPVQQQRADTFVFTFLQRMQIIYVSLQLSVQQGYSHPIPVLSKQRHQPIVTHPICFLGAFLVSILQKVQGVPLVLI